jgi:hypothetical protein
MSGQMKGRRRRKGSLMRWMGKWLWQTPTCRILEIGILQIALGKTMELI